MSGGDLPTESRTRHSGALARETPARRGTRRRGLRLALLVPGGVALLAGLNAGLERLGAAAPLSDGRMAGEHGTLMVLGFVGTLIALERAVALGRWWGFAAPALLGLGALASLVPAPRALGHSLTLLGTLALLALYVPLYRRQRDVAVALQLAGAGLAAGAALLLLRAVSYPVVVPWLAGFVILTIVGERLELARIVALDPAAVPWLLAITGAFSLGITLTAALPVAGYPVTGSALLGAVAWLIRYDVATKTIRGRGLPRFAAACLLAGYGWLAVAGAIWLLATGTPDGAAYDASVHAVFLGFTISMIMAHAPIILPAVLRRPLPYTAAFYAPAALLHVSLAIRLLVGDGFGSTHARVMGGALNVAAVVLFVLTAAAGSAQKGASR
ncbi:hypothetical protein [Cumulibacter manganitolerans]|uniref:hypothetical protein n=1 Tax=Cumulibacter manganitolerans TaxID=1884992 RepID=UPI001E392A3D|nr:hypothetical protein [Cumulibacter manganitolerans]